MLWVVEVAKWLACLRPSGNLPNTGTLRSEISFLHMSCMDLQQYAPPVSLAT
jgi:hypothetical protein